jgi:phosphoglycolate phosphatase-like HAD superfamily hydrolase
MRIVLDADGVFLRERPYWRTALAAALSLIGGENTDADTFRRLDAELFDRRAVQRIVKAVGINSNWHLCGVLIGSLREESSRRGIIEALARSQIGSAADRWVAALTGYVDHLRDQCDGSGSPVEYLCRQPMFAPVIPRFQDIFHGLDRRFDIRPKYQTLGEPTALRDTFDRLRRAGATLAVCTGRYRREVAEPLLEFGLMEEPIRERLITQDEVEQAEAATGLPALGKPHWFPLAAAVCGFDTAIAALRDDRPLNGLLDECVVFAGDGTADFRSAVNYSERGGNVEFVLVRSGALSEQSVNEILEAPITLGVIERFESLPDLLKEAAA